MRRKSTHHNKTHDYTQGNMYTALAGLSAPLIAGNILQQFYNTIDAFVVGRFAGNEEFAAIGVAGTIMNLFLFMIVGACTGLSVLFARFYGTKDYKMLHRQHFTALISGLIFSVLLCISGNLCMKPILSLIQTPSQIYRYTAEYLWWIFLSLPAAFLYNMYASALRASGDTLAALFILMAAVTSNLILDVVFVAHMGLGIRGAAQATAITQVISAVLCILYLVWCHREFIFGKDDCRIEKSMLTTTVKCSCATAVHQTSLYIGKMLIQGTVNTAGTDAISAYTAATRIEGFANSFGDSNSAATSVMISQNYGSDNQKRVKKGLKCSLTLSFLLGLACAIVLYITASPASSLMLGATNNSALTSSVGYLKIISLFYPFCLTGSSFTGYYNGTGKVFVTLAGSTGQITIRVILSWIMFGQMQLNAVSTATGLGWIAANVFWLLYFICHNKKMHHQQASYQA